MNVNKFKTLKSGLTLVELSVAILVLLLFVGLLLIAATAWKRGTDRAGCLMNIRQVQLALRGFANVNSLEPGDPLVFTAEPHKTVIGPNKFIEVMPLCPGGGLYSFKGPVVPPVGKLFMTCSLAGRENHEPDEFGSW